MKRPAAPGGFAAISPVARRRHDSAPNLRSDGSTKSRAGGSHRRVAWCTMKTPYDVLGVAPDADEKAIGNAFRAAAKACHPDLNPEDRAAGRQFKQITAGRDPREKTGGGA